jgi:hypothetical protein
MDDFLLGSRRTTRLLDIADVLLDGVGNVEDHVERLMHAFRFRLRL